MAYVHPAWEEYQRQRFTRPDGDRYLKPEPFDHKAFIDEYRAQIRFIMPNRRCF